MPVTRSQFKLKRRSPSGDDPVCEFNSSNEDQEEIELESELEKALQQDEGSEQEYSDESCESESNVSDEAMESEDEDSVIDEMDNEEDGNASGISNSKFALLVKKLEECLTSDEANEKGVVSLLAELDNRISSYLQVALVPRTDGSEEDAVELLRQFEQSIEILTKMVHQKPSDSASVEKAAEVLNNFAAIEKGTCALQASVNTACLSLYLSDEEKLINLIQNFGSTMKTAPGSKCTFITREIIQSLDAKAKEGHHITDIFVTNLMTLLESLPQPEFNDKKRKRGSYEHGLDRLWTALICGVDLKSSSSSSTIPLNTYNSRRLLIWLPTKVFPCLHNAQIAADFLQSYFHQGGIYSFLALEGIFILMTKYHLEVPKFYQKLYGLLNASLFSSKYRNVYFKMLDRFLSSAYLPDYLVRSFVKKFSRLALGAPCDALFGLLPIILNLIIRFPSLKSLVDAENQTDSADDPFDANEPDPMKSNANNSCLWEVKTLTQHAVPIVAELALASLRRPLPKQESDLSRRINTTSEFVFKSVTTKVVPPDVALSISCQADFFKIGFD
ncbi:unnamed protein product [Notodromas monacha]|uniref:CCAAT-binding factor domain-containing protein n=1 Tax=Notodromas monacha TaxID=399045 RepID=A0A7R9GHN2_9CRUS|nr:unnamed protein product [Notodromas monacha]CAG0921661.1 unnamed protein product [Notodromas monacha]